MSDVKRIECSCKDWKENLPKLNSLAILSDIHGAKYNGKIFEFCPWCGNILERRDV